MSNYIAERSAGREHIPLYPQGFVAVRIIQLVLGVICLGLSAYIVSVVPFTATVLMLFTAIVCLISSIYLLVAHFGSPAAYNYWAVLGLDIFHVIFWLISFAYVAALAAALLDYSSDYGGFYYDAYAFGVVGAIAAAAAALGGVQWVVYIVALVLHSIALHRHRKVGLHAMPGTTSTGPVAGTPAVGGAEKFQMQPQPSQPYYPPQPNVVEAPQQYQQQQQQPPQQQQQQHYQQQVYQQQPQQPQPQTY
ncbi:hypothetical protein F4802DRAFT_247417 [Xylaria palmicola]|nr:hypothetical protein F4802DRAFT_247417 [Xylaria palmicola]